MKLGIKLLVVIVVISIFGYWLINHSGYFPYSRNPMQYMPNMHRSPAIRPQEEFTLPDGRKAPLPQPAGTLSRTQFVYPYDRNTPAEEVVARANPLPRTRKVVERGQAMYETFCIVCHGNVGHGDGFVVPPFPKPPSLHSERVRGLADSQIFHIITNGQNTMMPYSPQIRLDDRWAIVHYVRVLQRAENPSEEDIRAFDEFIGGTEEKD